MLKKQPKGLYVLALANAFERLGFYTILSILMVFLQMQFDFSASTAGFIYSTFLALVYFMPLFLGGILADIFGYGKMVVLGLLFFFFGYIILALPLGSGSVSSMAIMGALLLVALGSGLYKGNLQVIVGNLYDDPKYKDLRDSGFIIFYMFINLGAMLAPFAIIRLLNSAQKNFGMSIETSFHITAVMACVSLIISFVLYYVFRHTFKHAENSVISNLIFKKSDPNTTSSLQATFLRK